MARSRKLEVLLSSLLVGALGCGGDSPSGADAASGGGSDATAAADAAGGSADADTPAGDPADPGSWEVHVDDSITVTIDTKAIGITVCSPATGGAPVATPSPLVIMSPGFQLPRTQYRSMCEHLASWGYLTIARDFTGTLLDSPNHQVLADRTSALLDWALSTLASRIDATRIGLAGHSLGGKISIFTAILDDRIDAVVGWDPVDAKPPVDNGSPSVTPERMDELAVPLAVIGETADTSCAPTEDNFTQYYEYACNAEAIQVTVDGADHMDWLDDRSTCGLTCGFCANGTIEDATTRAITRRLTVAFFERHLRASTAVDTYLSATGIGANATLVSQTSCP